MLYIKMFHYVKMVGRRGEIMISYNIKTKCYGTAVIIILLLLFPSISTAARANKWVESQIEQTMQRFSKAYTDKDINAIMNIYSAEQDTVAIGTNEDERLVGPASIRAAYENDFAAFAQITGMDYKIRAVSVYGNVAWFFADLTVSVVYNGKPSSSTGRLTAVLRRINGRWRILQSHFSFPVLKK